MEQQNRHREDRLLCEACNGLKNENEYIVSLCPNMGRVDDDDDEEEKKSEENNRMITVVIMLLDKKEHMMNDISRGSKERQQSKKERPNGWSVV